MGAVRIRNEFYTGEGVRYRVDIFDEDYASSIITTFEDNGFELEYDRPDKFLSPLISSSCYYTLMDDGSASFISFKADLANAQENEFKLIIYIYSGGSWVIHWAGVIMSDLVSWDNCETPRPFEIVAKCGLNRLENIPFNKILTTPYTSDPLQTIKKIIFDCLSYNGTAQFWNGSTKPYMACNLKWHDTLQTSISQPQILDVIYIGREFLIDDPEFNPLASKFINRGADDPPLSVKKVLSEILQLFACRLILSEGTWKIIQVSEYYKSTDSDGTYDYLGAYISSAGTTVKLTENGLTTATLAVCANGKFGYYPTVRNAKAQVYPSEILRSLYTVNESINENNLTFTSDTFDLGTLYGGTDIQFQFVLNYDVLKWAASIGVDWYIEAKVKIVAGSYRIKNPDATLVSVAGVADWTTTSADEYIYNISHWAMGHDTVNRTLEIVVRSEDIPFAEEDDCTAVVVCTLKSWTAQTNYPVKAHLNVLFKFISFMVLDVSVDPPIYGEITEINKINALSPAVTDNSIEINYGLLRISDNLGSASVPSLNTIMVMAPGMASPLVRSSTWVAGHTVDEDLVSTLLVETIALQKTAVKKYTGAFRSTIYNAWNSILYDNEIWVFMGARYTAKTDEWNGEWFGIAVDLSASTSEERIKNTRNGLNVSPVGTTKYFDPTLFNPVGIPLATINGKQDGGATVVSFDTDAIAFRMIRSGDNLMVLNSLTLENAQTFTCDADVEIGDVAVSVTSETADVDIWQSFILAHNPREIVASEILRGDYLQIQQHEEQGIGNGFNQVWNLKVRTTTNTTTTLTTDGLATSGITNVPLIPTDCAVAGVVTISVKKETSASCGCFVRSFLMVNDSGTSTIEGTIQTIGTDIVTAELASVLIDAQVDNTYDTILIKVDGIAATNLQWTARLELVISKYA